MVVGEADGQMMIPATSLILMKKLSTIELLGLMLNSPQVKGGLPHYVKKVQG